MDGGHFAIDVTILISLMRSLWTKYVLTYYFEVWNINEI